MKRSKFSAAEIEEARKVLGLGEAGSIEEIKAAYRRLCKRWHPDTIGDAPRSSRKMKELNAAYRLLLAYCENYRFSFAPETVESFDPERWWYNRFGENIRAPTDQDEKE